MAYEIPGFKEWLGVYFAEKGHWKLTNKGIEELSDKTAKLYTEFAEDYNSREREERLNYSSISEKELKTSAYIKAEELIEQGKASELLNKELIKTRKKGSWKDEKTRKEVAEKFLIAYMLDNKNPRDLTFKDFIKNEMGGFMYYYNNSPYKLIKNFFPNIKPWEMLNPSCLWNNKNDRIEAVKWIIEKLNKNPRDLTFKDFRENKLGGLISLYNSSPYLLLKEIFPDIKMSRRLYKHWNKKENRKEAVIWLIEKTGKDPRELTIKDFYENKLLGLLDHSNNSLYLIITEVFPDIKPWELAHTTKHYFDQIENRIESIKYLIKKNKKDPKKLTTTDFYENKLGGLLTHHYSGSPYLAVKEAFPYIKPEEMNHKPKRI